MTAEEAQALIERHAEALRAHFDAVQIITTRPAPEGDGTECHQAGEGNWFARYGAVREWVIEAEERTRDGARRDDDER